MKTKVFIDGSEGTTGLRIDERFRERDDIELLKIDADKRKDPLERKRLINASDITFLCLPDDAARESVSLVENENVCIIDTSTAHRTESGWAYGFPELSKQHRDQIIHGKRIAVPGCHASGFVSLVYPLVASGILPRDYPVSSFSLTGYSGGGKKTIAAYEEADRPVEFSSPREYALTQSHKHLKEMQTVTGLLRAPLFSPIIADFYSGMVVSVPLYTELLQEKMSRGKLQAYFEAYYSGQRFIQVCAPEDEAVRDGYLASNEMSGRDSMRIFITGNDERVVLSAQFDNLGKGASGAAVECMNLVLGCDEAKGLHLGTVQK